MKDTRRTKDADAVTCVDCGKVDNGRLYPPGTSLKMQCPHCSDDGPYAHRCRGCCSTGHGTRWPPMRRCKGKTTTTPLTNTCPACGHHWADKEPTP